MQNWTITNDEDGSITIRLDSRLNYTPFVTISMKDECLPDAEVILVGRREIQETIFALQSILSQIGSLNNQVY